VDGKILIVSSLQVFQKSEEPNLLRYILPEVPPNSRHGYVDPTCDLPAVSMSSSNRQA
jgi:hypothetical protein